MTNNLQHHYDKAMEELEKEFAKFANTHPLVTNKLQNQRSQQDPLSTHLLQSFALLSANLQQRLDANIPELCNNLLDIVYPHYTQPIPSTCIAQFQSSAHLQQPCHIKKGTCMLATSQNNIASRFTTTQGFDLLPIKISDIRVAESQGKSVLEIHLTHLDPDKRISELNLTTLAFYISAPKPINYQLYQSLCKTKQGSLFSAEGNHASPCHITPMGFAEDQTLLPKIENAFSGFQLLTDYFTLPEKFIFFSINNIDPSFMQSVQHSLVISLNLNEFDKKLAPNITQQTLRLNCTPITNLYTKHLDPIIIDHTQYEYLIHDPQQSHDQIHSIQSLLIHDDSNEVIPCLPLCKHSPYLQPHVYWSLITKSNNEHWIQLIDNHDFVDKSQSWLLNIQALCTNPAFCEKPNQDASSLALTLWNESQENIEHIHSVCRLTPSLPPLAQTQAQWSLLSHLSANASILSGSTPQPLQSLLTLYNQSGDNQKQQFIDSIININAHPISIRHPDHPTKGFCQGLKITIMIDAPAADHPEIYLFGSVLAKFLRLYASINTFIQLCFHNNKHEEIAQWPPEIGTSKIL